jgi:dihydroorotase
MPQTISSDLHAQNLHGPVHDLATVVTKFLDLGLSLDDAIARVTSAPADTIQMGDRIGTLAPGAWGDAVVFEWRKGSVQLEDATGEYRTGRQNLEPIVVVKSGRVVRDHGRTVAPHVHPHD